MVISPASPLLGRVCHESRHRAQACPLCDLSRRCCKPVDLKCVQFLQGGKVAGDPSVLTGLLTLCHMFSRKLNVASSCKILSSDTKVIIEFPVIFLLFGRKSARLFCRPISGTRAHDTSRCNIYSTVRP